MQILQIYVKLFSATKENGKTLKIVKNICQIFRIKCFNFLFQKDISY